MLRKLTVKNFKALRRLELDFGRLNVVVGPNGCGKTSILQAANLVTEVAGSAHGFSTRGDFAHEAVVTKGVNEAIQFTAHGEWAGSTGSLSFAIHGDQRLTQKSLAYEFAGRPGKQNRNGRVEPIARAEPILASELGSAAFLRLNAHSLGQASYLSDVPPRMASDGYGLATVLNDLQAREPDAFKDFQDSVRAVLPMVDRVRTHRRKIHQVQRHTVTIDDAKQEVRRIEQAIGDEILLDIAGVRGIPGPHVSDGTLITLAILATLHGDARPNLVMLDDLGDGLHPMAQVALVEVIRTLMDRFPKVQILAVTHSPYMVDNLRLEEVLAATLTDEGTLVIGRLTEHPDAARWRHEMDPGEFWSLVGEQWLTKKPIVNE